MNSKKLSIQIDEVKTMELSLFLSPIISIIAGLLILIFPRFLRVFLGTYLLIIGIIGLVF